MKRLVRSLIRHISLRSTTCRLDRVDKLLLLLNLALLILCLVRFQSSTEVVRSVQSESRRCVEDKVNSTEQAPLKWDKPEVEIELVKVWDSIDVPTRNLPGEVGAGVNYISAEQPQVNEAYKVYGFNQFVSDKISVNRSLQDYRDPICKTLKYKAQLPNISVIIIIYDEGWSTLFRTVFSVINRTPPELLHEIILVDDESTMHHLKGPLDDYVKSFPKIKVYHKLIREGLIQARNYGAERATGEVLVFLDSHCEASIGWLPPLLDPIVNDYRTVTCPIVDYIDHNTFHYQKESSLRQGYFNWFLEYKERSIGTIRSKQLSLTGKNIVNPVMIGGLFAISRKWFQSLGYYDRGLFIWGGEQFEISFKVWMCGGSMLNVPCSHVGHVFRGKIPFRPDTSIEKRHPNAVLTNFKRVAEVWMDDFKEILYYMYPSIGESDPGNLQEQLNLRWNLQCKSFRWYLKTVIGDLLLTAYEPVRAVGEIRNNHSGYCIDTLSAAAGSPVGVYKCHGLKGSQDFMYTHMLEIRHGSICLDARSADLNNVYAEKCHEMGGNQGFYIKNDVIKHALTGLCLSAASLKRISLVTCNKKDPYQRWSMKILPSGPPPAWSRLALHPSRPPPHFN